MQSQMEPVVFSPKSTAGLPFLSLVIILLLTIGITMVIKSLKTGGRIPVVPYLVIAVLGVAVFIMWQKIGVKAGTVEIYQDRIVTSDQTTVSLNTLTDLQIDSQMINTYVNGRPVPTVRRRLLAVTNQGSRIIATEDLFDIDAIQKTIDHAKRTLSDKYEKHAQRIQ